MCGKVIAASSIMNGVCYSCNLSVKCDSVFPLYFNPSVLINHLAVHCFKGLKVYIIRLKSYRELEKRSLGKNI